MAGRDFSAELFGPAAGRDFSAELFGAKPPPEKQSAFRQIADVPLGIAKGAVQGVRMIADAFGAGSDTSKTIKSAETYLADLMSAQAKNDQQEISRIMKDAEDKGVLDQVKAGLKAFSVAPVDTLSSALGTAAPVIVGALGAKVLGAGALVSTGVSALTGAGMGAGTIKGSIYEETKNTLKKAGASEEEAERRAQLAQEYGGKNLDQILLGTVLGGAAALGPLEKGGAAILARRILGKTGVEATESVAEQTAKGALRRRAEAGLLEAAPEALQAGQEQVAQNIALQREGFEDVPTFRGAFSAATMEALAGFGLGTTIGGGRPEAPPAAEVQPSVTPEAPPPELPTAEAPPVEAPPAEPSVAETPPAEPPAIPPAPIAEEPPVAPTVVETPQVETPVAETPPVEPPVAPEAPKLITAQMLEDIGVRPTSAVVKRIEGLPIDAPEVASELTNYANRYAAPEVKLQIQSFIQSIAAPAVPEVVSAAPDVAPTTVEAATAPEVPAAVEPPKVISSQMLQDIGVRPSAAIVKRLDGLPIDDPKVATELESYANRFATPEAKPQILNFVQTLRQPVVDQPVTEAPVAPTAVTEAPAVEQPATQPVAEKPAVAAPTVAETPTKPDRAAVQSTLNTLNEGDTIVTDDGDRIPVSRVVRNKAGDVTAVVTTRIGEEGYTGIDFDGLASLVTSQPYIDSATGERKFSAPATIEKPKAAAAAPSPTAEVPESKTATGQQAGWVLRNKDTGEVVMETNDPAKVKALNTEKYEAVPIAQYLASLSKPQKPAETKAEAPAVEAPATRKEAQAFGKAIGAAQPYPGELRGRVNLPAQKAAKEGNFQGVLSALEKSKNVIVSEIAKRAKSLGTKIVIDDNAEETYTGQSTLMRQMSIDGAKMHLEALNKIRALAPQVDALPDRAELGYALRDEKITAIDGGEEAGPMSLEDIAKMGHSMFAPLATGPLKLRTKEDFKALQKAYEDLTYEYGENALQLTSTGSAQMTGVAGAYDAGADTIRVSEYFAKREEVLAHEIVHAQTVQAIASPTLRQKSIVARLNKLYEHVKKELEAQGRSPYGIQSIQEFVAEGIGNPAFQFLLKKIKYENTSAWDSFVQTIANLIGVKRDTAFTELLSIYSDLTTEQKAAPKAEAPTAKPVEEAPAAPPILDTTGIKEVKGRHPQVQAAAQLLQDKKMTREEFEKYVDYYKPIQEVEAEKLLPPTSEQRMNETVNADKRDKINVPVADGTKVGLRMDLPARERGGSVVSIHEGKPGKLTVGKLMGFRSTGWLKDVTFEVRSQEKGLAVATGAAKAPQQTVEGTWFNLGPEETYARVKELMKDPAWTQVGFDPSRHGYFYDRKTREPVVSASEMYQVGQFLLAKDVKYAPKTDFLYSLGKEQTKQLQDFQQTLRNLLNKFGLKDVGLNIEEGMRDAGSYSQQLIRIASDEANPIRTLRHEAIHALRELGFFTDAQWKSLSKMAKDKWIDQYLKQKNEQGRPLKAGEESRYDAYMREYNGDMEKITEEAVADAFADFDATKPPAGMLQALLKRMKDLFQSIKSALTKIESPEQIFGKVEKGELKAGAKSEAGERKSLGKITDPGQQAIETINRMGMGVKPPEPGRIEKAKAYLKEAGENPAATKESAKQTLTKWLDAFETMAFSGDAAFNNKVTSSVIKDMKEQPELLGLLLEASQSQAVNADNVVSRGIIEGSIEYNEEMKKWQSVKKDENFSALAKKLDDLAKKYGTSKEEMERIAHTYLVVKRLPGIIQRNKDLDVAIEKEQATAKPDRKRIDEWKALKVYVSPEQEAQVEPGLSLIKTIPELKEVSDIWQGIRQNTIKAMVDSGLWSPEYATNMFDNIDYVPYYREEQLEEGAGPLEFIRGLQVKSKEFQLKGSGAPVNDVFDNMIRWSQYAMNRAIRAQKARQMIDAAKDIDIGDRKMAVRVTEEKRGMNIVRVFRDGKQELWDMADPMFVPAFSAIQNVSIPMFKWAAKVADVLRNSVVLYPMFSVAQVPQDSFAAMFTSGLKPQHALKIPILAVKEFVKTLNKSSATHNELVKFGVVGARDFSADVMRKDAEIYAGLKPPKGGWGKTKEVLEHIAMAADNAVRQAVYEASVDQGLSKAEALEKAFEIFNVRRRGTSKALNLAGQTIPFFYAYLAAQRVAYRTITGVGTSPTERKAALQTLAATSAAVFTLSMLYAMAVGDDEDYAETPAAVRDRTLTIPGTGGVRIPLRTDFFLFPKMIAEHTYLMLTDKGYEDGAKFRRSMRDALVSAVASPTPLPQIVKPVLEVAINYDFFTGKPVIGQFEKQKDWERQFNDSTSEFSKLLGKTGLVSPIAADHLIRGMFGSAGGLVMYASNFFTSDPDVPRPELSVKEMLAALPGTSGFLKRPQESALKNDFYVLRDEVEKAVNTFNDIKTRSPQGMEAFLADEKQMARLMLGKPVDKINREIAKIRRQITIVTNMPESQMSAEDKADFKRQLMEMERELLRSVNVKELREMAKI